MTYKACLTTVKTSASVKETLKELFKHTTVAALPMILLLAVPIIIVLSIVFKIDLMLSERKGRKYETSRS